MDAWILDESPGSVPVGNDRPAGPGADDVRIRVVASALNHMDLWVTRDCPSRRCRTSPDATSRAWSTPSATPSTVWPSVTRSSSTPGVSPVADIVALGNDSPMGPGFAIYGEHTWGGHATYATAPARNVAAARRTARGRSARRTRWPR